MISNEQKIHDLAVALAGHYTAQALASGEYQNESDVYKAITADAVSVYHIFSDYLSANKGL